MTKTELLALARERNLTGRSKMTKGELVAVLRDAEAGDPGGDAVRVRSAGSGRDASTDPTPPARRQLLAQRIAPFFDQGRTCPWTSLEGFPCGLPPIVDQDSCALHGGIDIFDLSLPITGRLGVETWPTLLRHLLISSYDIDPIGLDPVIAEVVWHLTNVLYFEYFRVEVEGIEHIPMTGPAVVAGNHGGAALPYDAFMLTAAVANEAAVPRRLRVVGTEIFNMLPWLSHLYRKAGGAYAAPGDVRHLLGHGRLVGVFPEGERGFMKPYSEAYRVQRFGRGGFLSLADEHDAPVVPVAIVGSEEVHPAVGVSKTLAKLVRLILPEQRVEQVAVVLNPIPLPVRWRIRFLPPLPTEGRRALDDPLRTLERTEEVRRSIQDALDDMVGTRRSAF